MIPDDVCRHLEAASWQRCQRDIADAIRAANDNVPMAERHDWLTARKVEAERRHYQRMSDARQRWRAVQTKAEADFRDNLCREWAEAA